jgi:hypothetical protein
MRPSAQALFKHLVPDGQCQRRKPEQGTIQMNQPVTQIETTKVMADPPRQPKQKATTVIVFFLVAAGALFIAIAASGIYTRNQWTAAVQQRTNEAARMLVEVAKEQKSRLE